MINYSSVAQKNDKIYGINDLNTLNKKMDFLLKGNITKKTKKNSLKGKVHPKVQKVLKDHELLEAFNKEDFKDMNFYDEESHLDVDEEILVHERVIFFFN